MRHFIDEHMNGKKYDLPPEGKKGSHKKALGLISPRFVLKFVSRSGRAETRVYFDKNQMMFDMTE